MPPKQDKKKRTMKFGARMDHDRREVRPRRNVGQDGKPNLKSEDKSIKDKPDQEEHNDNICVLCCEDIDIFAKGSCDHVICFKCSSRMRVLCEEKYCAVCRLELPQVVYMGKNLPFADLRVKDMPSKSKYGVFFENSDAEKKFRDLLQNICPICKENSRNFEDLRRHVRHVHEKQYCDICVRNLKIFPYELRVYTRSELVTHRKSGDPDNRSYKGHPQCEFCDERYFDNDELLLHLRKNHFWCHFCEKDGKQEYYENYEDLRTHFRNEHYLCEESECLHEKYTSVFRTDIDFQAHKLARHSKKLSKLAAKQARQLNVDIDYGTRKTHKGRVHNERQFSNRQDVESGKVKMTGNPTDKKRSVPPERREQEKVEGATGRDVREMNGTTDLAISQSLNAGAKPFVPADQKNDNDLKPKEITVAAVTRNAPPRSKSAGKKGKASGGAANQAYDASFPPLGDQSKGGARPKTTSPKVQRERKKKVPDSSVPNDQEKVDDAKANASNGSKVIKKSREEGQNQRPPETKKENTGPARAPPGFQTGKAEGSSAKQVPPGLKKNEKSINFRDSVLKNKSVNTESTEKRNAALVTRIRSLIQEDDFEHFREMSGSFRRSDISADLYFSVILNIFGSNLELIFKELVELLPDESKQQELWNVSSGRKVFQAPTFGINDTVPSNEARPGWKTRDETKIDHSKAKQEKVVWLQQGKLFDKDFIICEECGVPLKKKEVPNHMVIHCNSDFPALPSFSKPSKKPTWNQRTVPIVENSWGKLS